MRRASSHTTISKILQSPSHVRNTRNQIYLNMNLIKMRKLVQSDMELPTNSERMKTKIPLQIKRNNNIVVLLLPERKHPDKHQEEMLSKDSLERESVIMDHLSVHITGSTDLRSTKCQEACQSTTLEVTDQNLSHHNIADLKKVE